MVLDRAKFPRPKLCGDTLNPGALSVLQRLGLGCAAGVSVPLDGWIVTGEDGARVEGRYNGVNGRGISRGSFDAALMMAAAGARAPSEGGGLVQGPLVDSSSQHPAVTGLTVTGRQGESLQL